MKSYGNMLKRSFRSHTYYALCLIGLLSIYGTAAVAAEATDLLQREYREAIPVAETIGRAMSNGPAGVQTNRVQPSGYYALPPQNPIIGKHHLEFSGAYIFSLEAAGDLPAGRRMTGAVMHCDAYTRALCTRFTAVYELRNDGNLILKETKIDPLEPEYPRVAVFFVPAEAVDPPRFETLGGMEQLKYVIDRATLVEGRSKVSQNIRPYYVFAFVMERLAEDVRLDLTISRDSAGTAGYKTKAVHLQEDGWHLVYAPARFALNGESEVFFKVLKNSPRESRPSLIYVTSSFSLVKRIQIALNNRGYNPGPANGIPGPRTRQAIKAFQRKSQLEVDGNPSLALLQILTSSPELSPVRVAQQTLADLGYRPGPADGMMGPRTRGAIRKFQTDMGLKNNGRLPAELFAILVTTPAGTAVERVPSRTASPPSKTAAGAKFETYTSKMWPNEAR